MNPFGIFGFQIKSKKKDDEKELAPSVIAPTGDDGSAVLSSSSAAYYAHAVDIDATVKNEQELIRRYREISLHPECDSAIEEIVNEAICIDEKGVVATLNLDDLKVGDNVKKKIQDEFDEIKHLLEFDDKAHDLFRSWYIDGRQYHVITLNPESPKDGIIKVEKVDSRKIRKIKKVDKKKDPASGVDVVVKTEEFFLYNERGIDAGSLLGVKLSVDSVVYVPSGLFDENSNVMFSYLHKAIKPVNQLKMLEDAVVIYRLARAPERRIFYIDVGNLPKLKADQYVVDIMNKYKNKIVYDANTGEVKDDRKFMSMLEDFWMPRREGSKGTEITTLEGGLTLGNIEDIQYFQQKLYQSLNVPLGRLLPNQGFTLGRSNEITRDELKFNKFVSRLRNRFSQLLIDLLKVQLIAKNIVNTDDWDEVEKNISVTYSNDNNFVELRDNELWMGRLAMLQQADPFVGKYLSPEWIKTNVLKLTDKEIKQMDKEIEKMDPRYLPAEQQQMMMQQEQDAAAAEAANAPPPTKSLPTGEDDDEDSKPIPVINGSK